MVLFRTEDIVWNGWDDECAKIIVVQLPCLMDSLAIDEVGALENLVLLLGHYARVDCSKMTAGD